MASVMELSRVAHGPFEHQPVVGGRDARLEHRGRLAGNLEVGDSSKPLTRDCPWPTPAFATLEGESLGRKVGPRRDPLAPRVCLPIRFRRVSVLNVAFLVCR
jgi:hypothetical protein